MNAGNGSMPSLASGYRRGLIIALDGVALFGLAVLASAHRSGELPWQSAADVAAAISSYPAAWLASPGVGVVELAGYGGTVLLIVAPVWVAFEHHRGTVTDAPTQLNDSAESDHSRWDLPDVDVSVPTLGGADWADDARSENPGPEGEGSAVNPDGNPASEAGPDDPQSPFQRVRDKIDSAVMSDIDSFSGESVKDWITVDRLSKTEPATAQQPVKDIESGSAPAPVAVDWGSVPDAVSVADSDGGSKSPSEAVSEVTPVDIDWGAVPDAVQRADAAAWEPERPRRKRTTPDPRTVPWNELAPAVSSLNSGEWRDIAPTATEIAPTTVAWGTVPDAVSPVEPADVEWRKFEAAVEPIESVDPVNVERGAVPDAVTRVEPKDIDWGTVPNAIQRVEPNGERSTWVRLAQRVSNMIRRTTG